MASEFYEIDCGYDDPVMMERRDDGELFFHGWDQEAEQAAVELGFEPTLCHFLWITAREKRLNPTLFYASRMGNTNIVEAVLAAGADVNASNDLALRRASVMGHAATVEILLRAGANVFANDGEAYRDSCEEEVLEILERWMDTESHD